MRSKENQSRISQAKRIVIKVGSSILADPEGGLYQRVFRQLARSFAELAGDQGLEVLLVSSGAIACGMKKLNFTKRPTMIAELQACAASGQATLMQAYEKTFSSRKLMTAQLLLTRDDLQNRQRYINVKHTLNTLLKHKVVPIINENDTVSIDEIKVGDNDTLAAYVASLVEADLLILLTDCDGLHTADPRRDPAAVRLSVIKDIDTKTRAMASGTSWETRVGGMATKIEAARIAGRYGIATVVADGNENKAVLKIMAGKDIGTLFLPSQKALKARKHWIGFTVKAAGQVILDEGAVQAIVERRKSLLASGIQGVQGAFKIGDPVDLVDAQGTVVARGLTTYSAAELEKIKGCKSNQIEKILGYRYDDAVIHRDDMVILDES